MPATTISSCTVSRSPERSRSSVTCPGPAARARSWPVSSASSAPSTWPATCSTTARMRGSGSPRRRSPAGTSASWPAGNAYARRRPSGIRTGAPARRVTSAELDALGERQLVRVVDRIGRAAHVRLPRVRAGLAAAAGLLLATERATDLGAGWTDVDVGDAAVRTVRRGEPLGLADVEREDRRRQALGHLVVHGQRLIEVRVGHDVQDGRERLGPDDLALRGH